MEKMSEGLSKNLRQPMRVDMNEYLNSLEQIYLINLKETIDNFSTYDEVSAETYNDYRTLIGKLEVLHDLLVLDQEELTDISTYASKLRINMLEAMEKGGK